MQDASQGGQYNSIKGGDIMFKRIILATFCLFLSVMYFSGIAFSFQAIYDCYEQLLQKYPSVEAIKEQFGDGAKWNESIVPSIHDSSLELKIISMEYPGIEIRTLGYSIEGENSFSIVLLRVGEAGFVKLLEVGIDSSKEEVLSNFGEPQRIEENTLFYHDEAEFYLITFTIENNKVAAMSFANFPD